MNAMNPTTRKAMLKARPSSIFRLQAQTSTWLADTEQLMAFPSDMGALLNKLYDRTPSNQRANFAFFLSNSKYHHVVKSCDEEYLTVWLQQRFSQVVNSMKAGHLPEQRDSLRRTATSVLSTWLRESPHLRNDFAALVGECFYMNVPRVWPADKLEHALETVIPRQFRTPLFYEKILGNAPHLTVVSARHVQEHRHIMQLSRTQCRYAAALPGGWRALYPQSVHAEQINSVFEVMGTLDYYDPDTLRTALGMQSVPTTIEAELPAGFDTAACTTSI